MSVYVSIPIHSRQIDAGLLTASHNMGDVDTVLNWSAGSLLAANFNKALCAAKNGGHEWLLLWHGDIVPDERGWLARLLGIASDKRADLLAGVALMKGPHGLTSTAADTADGLRRITVKELARLPDVFCVADVTDRLWPASRLLVNTGLLLIRMEAVDPSRLFFTIRDRVEMDSAGKYGFRVLPEDWGVSRAAERAGLRVYATKAIEILHVGSVEYSSRCAPFGLETDAPVPSVWECA